MENQNDFLIQLKALSTRLKKKKLLRKTPYNDIANQYIVLRKGLQREMHNPDRPHFYAALCYSAAARCYDALGQVTKQANQLVQAGAALCANGCVASPVGADLLGWTEIQSEAIGCFLDAARLYVGAGQSHAAATAVAEMAMLLIELDQLAEASRALQRAADLLGPAFPLTAVDLLIDAAKLEVELDERKRAAQALGAAVELMDQLILGESSYETIGDGRHRFIDVSLASLTHKLTNCRVTLALLAASQGKFGVAKNWLRPLLGLGIIPVASKTRSARGGGRGVDSVAVAAATAAADEEDTQLLMDMNPTTSPPVLLLYLWVVAETAGDSALSQELSSLLLKSPLLMQSATNHSLFANFKSL